MEPEEERLWNSACEAEKLGDKAGALFLFKKIANTGNKYAYFEIARILEFGGENVETDIESSIHWYEKAFTENKDEYSAFALGRIYFAGMGVPVNYSKAFKYLSFLSNSKQPGAIYALGVCYECGWGVDRSLRTALRYYEKAARYGHLLALERIGRIKLKRGRLLSGMKYYFSARLKIAKLMNKDPDNFKKNWEVGVRVLRNEEEESLYQRIRLP